MIWFKRQSLNPDKHPMMPSEYPWQVQNEEPESLENWETVETQIDFDNLVNTFDLTNYNSAMTTEESSEKQQSGREFGQSILNDFIDAIGTRNLDLSKAGATINTLAIAQDNAAVKLLIETGAIKTASDLMLSLKIKYPTHADLYEWAYNKIHTFLTERGYI
jgi:hypothetical protein